MIQMKKVTAEEIGIHSRYVLAFIEEVERKQLCMHGFILIRNGCIGAEGYWKPVTQEEPHRIYSATKTFVAAAIGVLADEGKITLDDKVVDYFPDLLPEEGAHPYLARATIRNLLMMATCYRLPTYDFGMEEWLKSYFHAEPDHLPGLVFNYDSCGSYVLGALVKRVTGKTFLEYLMEKVLLKIGFSPDRKCLEGPDGELWGGSGLVITLREMAAFAKLLLDGGKWGNEQLISQSFIREATAKQISLRPDGANYEYQDSYGYQIWRTKDGAFYLNGAGGQLAICFPDTGLVFACTADCQGNPQGKYQIFDALWRNIVHNLTDPMPADEDAGKDLEARCQALELPPLKGEAYSPLQQKLEGRTYILNQNPMGIEKLQLHFDQGQGALCYETPRGKKKLLFGMGKCLVDKFPETHYPGFRLGTLANREYRCVNCGSWIQENMLGIRVQIIDEYVGNLTIVLSFVGDDVGIHMVKSAQFFLNEYQGFASGSLSTEKE